MNYLNKKIDFHREKLRENTDWVKENLNKSPFWISTIYEQVSYFYYNRFDEK